MTELKYLEEVLPAYRAGKTIQYYNGETKAKEFNLHKFPMGDYSVPWFTFKDRCWIVLPELVSWPVAWEALKAGKKIRIDSIVYHAQIHIPGGTVKKQLCLYYEDPKNFGNETCMGHNIPIEWLDRNDFEVVGG